MKPVETVEVEQMCAQIDYMITCSRTLLAKSVGDKNGLGVAYDSGYLACLTEIREILRNPELQTELKNMGKTMVDTNDIIGEDDE